MITPYRGETEIFRVKGCAFVFACMDRDGQFQKIFHRKLLISSHDDVSGSHQV